MRNKSLVLLIIIALALLARLTFAGAVVGWSKAPLGDETDYFAGAVSIADGDGYTVDGVPMVRRAPVYSYFLAGLFVVSGPSVAAARVTQVLLGTMVVLLIFVVARIYFGDTTAIIATALAAVNPFMIFVSGYLLTENLYIVLLLLCLWVLPTVASFAGSWRAIIVGGVLLGLASLTRPTGFTYALWVAAASVIFLRASWRDRLLRPGVFMALVVLCLLPWGLRNQAAYGKLTLFTLQGGTTFYQGNNASVLEEPSYYGGVAPLYMLPRHQEIRTMATVPKDSLCWALGKQFLRDNKSKVPLLAARKFQRLWRFRSDVGMAGIRSGWWFDNNSVLGRIASTFDAGFVYALFVIPLFVVGLVWTRREYQKLWFVYGIIVAHTAIAMVFHGSLRMRMPIEPVIVMLAADAIRRLLVWYRAKRRSSAPLPQ